MTERIKPAGRQKSMFMVHTIVFIIANIIIWYMYKHEGDVTGKWVYPWQAWITAAWALSLIGHWCAVYRSYTDPGMQEYERQLKG